MNKKINFILIAIISTYTFLYQPRAWAQESLIEIALGARKSIVTVSARKVGLQASPKAEAAYDPKTKKILVAQNIRTFQYGKNGAGVIINKRGLIVTNYHIIQGASHIFVKLFDERTTLAKVLHVSPKSDLALLKVTFPSLLQPIHLADSNTVKLGDKVVNIGNSKFLKETLSGGQVIGLGTSSIGTNPKTVELIKVNINLAKGDSGGPLLNQYGELIGMVSAKLKNKERAIFAIPSNKIKILFLDYIN